MGITVHPEVWYHPQMGLVKFHVDWPEPNRVGMDLKEIQDFGSATSGLATIRKSMILAAKNQTSNGIAYHIEVTYPDDFTDPLRVTGRILYHLWTPTE